MRTTLILLLLLPACFATTFEQALDAERAQKPSPRRRKEVWLRQSASQLSGPHYLNEEANSDSQWVIVITNLKNWKTRVESVLPAIPDSVIVLDFKIGSFPLSKLEEFIRVINPPAVLLGWDQANHFDFPGRMEDMVKDFEYVSEVVKRVDSKTFIWVTVCKGIDSTDRWIELLKNSKVSWDGVALHNVYTYPYGSAEPFLENVYSWAEQRFPNKEIALSGFYGANPGKPWTPFVVSRRNGRVQRVKEMNLGFRQVWFLDKRLKK